MRRTHVIMNRGTSTALNPFTFNAGHYLRYIPSGTSNVWYYNLSVASVRQELMDFIDTVPSVVPTGIQGFLVNVGMSAIETSFGNYNFTGVNAVFNKLKSKGYRMWLAMQTDTQFLDIDAFPQYMLDAPSTYFTSRFQNNQYFVTLAWWRPTPQLRLIALQNAIAASYGNDPMFEGYTLTGETAFESYDIGTANVDGTYTYSSAKNGFQALAAAWRQAAPTKMAGQYFNDVKDDTIETFQEYYSICAQYQVMHQNPNNVRYSCDTGQIAVCGMNYSGVRPSSFTDYTPIIPMAADGDDDNDYYANNPAGSPSQYGTPYQTLDQYWASSSGPHTGITNFPTASGTGVHGPFAWNLTSPLTLPQNNCSHIFWDVNYILNGGGLRGGDATNSWAVQITKLNSIWIPNTPAYTIPTCLGIVGGGGGGGGGGGTIPSVTQTTAVTQIVFLSNSGSIPITVAAGRDIVVQIAGQQFSTTPAFAVDDGNAYTEESKSITGQVIAAQYRLRSVTGGLHTINITCPSTPDNTYCYAIASEVQGTLNASVDQTVINGGTSTASISGNTGPLAQTNEIMFTTFAYDGDSSGSTYPPATGWNGLAQDTTAGYAFAYKIPTDATPQNATQGTAFTRTWSAALNTFRGA